MFGLSEQEFIRFLSEKLYARNVHFALRETRACMFTNASKFWAGRAESLPGGVEFYIEHQKDIGFRMNAPEISHTV